MAENTPPPTEPPVTPPPTPPAGTPAQQSELIFGKFTTIAEAEKAYKGLEQKLHSAAPAQPAPAKPDNGLSLDAPAPDAPKEFENLSDLIAASGLKPEDIASTFAKEGKLTDDQYAAFKKHGISRGLVNEHLSLAKESQARALADATAQCHNSVGGEDQWNTLRKGLGHLAPMRKADIERRLLSGDTRLGAIHEMVTEYNLKAGTAGAKMIVVPGGVSIAGRQSPTGGQGGFTSVNEIVDAMDAARRKGYAEPLHPTRGDPDLNSRIKATSPDIINQLTRK